MSDIPNKLRFCCLPVLPTIFSDELSYLDVLSKMRDYINQMIDAIKQQDEDIANIQTQVDKVDPSKYIQTSGGTLTGPLFFIDNAHVLKNEDGTITLSGTGQMNIHGGGNVTIDTPENIAIRADKHVDITGGGGVEILVGENGAVNIEAGAVAMTGDINIHGPTTFDKVDVDMLNARTKVAEPVEDANPATKKYVDAHGSSGGVTCGYITVAVDDTKNTVDVRSENLIPKGELKGYYVDNAGNLWHATQVVAAGFTLENQNINVLANAEFVKITGNTSVKNINVNDTGSSTYQATTNILVHGGTDVDITAGNGTVDLEAPIVDIHAAQHVNIDTGDGGSVVIGGAKSAVDMGNAVSVLVPAPTKPTEAANKDYVDNLIGPRMEMLKRITAQAPYLGIPGDAFANYTEANIFIQASPDSTANEVWIGTILLQGGSVADCHVVSIDATTGTQQLIQADKFLVSGSGMIINGLSPTAARGCYFVIPS
nr:MAG TPA: hypothetical protein [Caudoviricetes sp.]